VNCTASSNVSCPEVLQNMNIPNDPAILLSYINTQLRDSGQDLNDLCKSLCIEKNAVSEKLASIGFVYDPEKNCFK